MSSWNTATRSDATFTLRDGRILSYLEYGDPVGRPVFFCHGTPSSRLYHHPDISIPTSLGVRLIAVDRPGYGVSTFQPGRTLVDWPLDVAELADSLGIGRFAIVGLSGGGPHALACAAKLPDRLTHVGLVASAAPFDAPDATAGMAKNNRIALAVTRALPFAVLRGVYSWSARAELKHPEATLTAQSAQLDVSDRAVWESAAWRAMEVENVREAYRQGARGHAWEGRMLTRAWGLRIEEIVPQVHLWHGESDTLVPPTVGYFLATKLRRCQVTFVPKVGHLALFFHQWRDVLATMIS
ncbi:MAG: alpha/beta fold hydrolase [Ktedonobacterales bacterium]